MTDKIPSSLLLPSELKCRIADLSSRSSLSSLARTHTTFQREAERALYRYLVILSQDLNSFRCMETLATNSEKAGFVHSLAMELQMRKPGSDIYESDRAIMSYLFKGLVNMHSLSDFRLRMFNHELWPWNSRLNIILCEGHFQLQTLYCNEELDFSQILKSQTELRILGIYGQQNLSEYLETLKQIHIAGSFRPIVFNLESQSYNFPRIFDHMSLFPAFYSVDRIATIHPVLVKSFDEDQDSDIRVNVNQVSSLSIYLVKSSDIPIIHTLAKDISVTFFWIAQLKIFFEYECEIPSQGMKEFLSFFQNLSYLHFYLWPTKLHGGRYYTADLNISTDVYMAHVKEWEVACPTLRSVSFIDRSLLEKKKRENGLTEWTRAR